MADEADKFPPSTKPFLATLLSYFLRLDPFFWLCENVFDKIDFPLPSSCRCRKFFFFFFDCGTDL